MLLWLPELVQLSVHVSTAVHTVWSQYTHWNYYGMDIHWLSSGLTTVHTRDTSYHAVYSSWLVVRLISLLMYAVCHAVLYWKYSPLEFGGKNSSLHMPTITNYGRGWNWRPPVKTAIKRFPCILRKWLMSRLLERDDFNLIFWACIETQGIAQAFGGSILFLTKLILCFFCPSIRLREKLKVTYCSGWNLHDCMYSVLLHMYSVASIVICPSRVAICSFPVLVSWWW